MADFHEYYSGTRTAPYLTIFIGGNHEASNHLFELYYGGWVAPNIYYLGAANVLRLGNLRIAGLSGIWKTYDFRKPHFERLPYNREEETSIFHVRELDVRKVLSIRTQVDICLSHDWPQGVEWKGNYDWLFRTKRHFSQDANSGKLGSVAAKQCLDRLRPQHWFSAHMHVKYSAVINHSQAANEEIAQYYRSTRSNGKLRTQKENGIKSLQPEHQAQVSAWHQFHDVDQAAVLAEQQLTDDEQADKGSGKRPFQQYNYDETFRKVSTDNLSRREVLEGHKVESEVPLRTEDDLLIPQLDGTMFLRFTKKRRISADLSSDATPPTLATNTQTPPLPSSALHNPDAIDLLSESDDEDALKDASSHGDSPSQPSLQPTANGSNVQNVASEQQTIPTQTQDHRQTKDPLIQQPEDAVQLVDEDLRAELAAMSSNFAEEVPVEVSPTLPFPEDIINQTTRFLSLDKCEEHRDFLQLMEIPSISTPDGPIRRPVKLGYDPEWLAILRVFAPELKLGGDARDKVPIHKGDTFYRQRILEEEAWVKHNVTDKKGLTVPENFMITAPVYDEQEEVSSDDSPREVTNLQTVAFCEMIGIDCLFDVSEEDRDKRMQAGPKPESDRFKEYATKGRNRGARSRGGGSGGGRGGWGGAGERGGHRGRGGRGGFRGGGGGGRGGHWRGGQ
jgi:lariat debranching enzyme